MLKFQLKTCLQFIWPFLWLLLNLVWSTTSSVHFVAGNRELQFLCLFETLSFSRKCNFKCLLFYVLPLAVKLLLLTAIAWKFISLALYLIFIHFQVCLLLSKSLTASWWAELWWDADEDDNDADAEAEAKAEAEACFMLNWNFAMRSVAIMFSVCLLCLFC